MRALQKLPKPEILARHDARRSPEFRALVARTTPRSTWRKVAPAASALALASCVLLGLQLTSRSDRAPMSAAAPPPAAMPGATAAAHSPGALAAPDATDATDALAAADVPLDFLLTLPGATALSGVPSFESNLPLPGRTR